MFGQGPADVLAPESCGGLGVMSANGMNGVVSHVRQRMKIHPRFDSGFLRVVVGHHP